MAKKKKFTTLFTLCMMVLVLGVGALQIYKVNQNSKSIDHVGVEGSTNSYTIRANATPYQKEIYDQLNDAIADKDEPKTAGLIAANFIADFFTWTNKIRLNDVGGLQFIHKDAINSVSHAAQDGIYNDMYTYLSEGKIANTLQVKATEINTVSTTFKYEDLTTDAFKVNVTWEYEDSDVLNTSVFQNKATLILLKDADGLYSIVEVKDYE